MQLNQEILHYIDEHREEALQLLIELAQIPAPSNHEQKRAAFCKAWMEKQGAKGVYIDEALNVIYPVGCTDDKPLVVYMAHSDVVFPDMDRLPLRVEEGRIYCPGVGDDTANVAALLTVAKYIAQHEVKPRNEGVLIVINSGEEGLGNLKGSRRIVADFGSRIREFITLDGGGTGGVNRAVGSKRYRISVDTEGGHSYGAFGNRNAIAYLASMIDVLYTMKVPPKGKTTYNVGTISGGTSVNTIAQHAQMLYEFRSDERESLAVMEQHLNATVDLYRAKGVEVSVELVGDRPCSGEVDEVRERALMGRAGAVCEKHFEGTMSWHAGSTDCNVPLAAGIPAVCVGCYMGRGAHTREEYVEIDSLLPGLRVAFELLLHHFE